MRMIVNTAAYLFVPLADAEALTATLHERAKALELRGTILIAEEGINLFLAGSSEGIDGFYSQLKTDARFADMRIKYSHSQMQPFARLKAKFKSEIISFRREDGQPVDYPRAALAATGAR